MQEREFNLKDMLCYTLRKWRIIVILAVTCAILFAAFAATTRILDMNDPKKVERWEAEYEVAQGSYWAPIYAVDLKVKENERLASQAQLDIEELNDKKTEYEAQITDYEAKIAYYEALIGDYRANIEQLKTERETLDYYLTYRQQRNENSLLMKIDPYEVNTYEAYLRVDSGYVILPENSYQNPDPTSEIRQTYRLLVNNTEFYAKMIEDLELATEVRYLTEVISVSDYGTHSMRVRVISDDVDWAKKVGEYITKAIQANHTQVSASIAEHTLVHYNTFECSTVDLSVYTTQNTYREEVADYETSIREINTSILQTEVDIRDMDTEIRLSRQLIKDAEKAIKELPLEKQALEQQISDYQTANLKLRADQLALKEKPEPQYGGHTTSTVISASVKYALLGAAVGAFLMVLYFLIMALANEKALSSEQICQVLNSKFFGFWPKKGKKLFGFIDRWIAHLAGDATKGLSPELATELVLANIKLACAANAKILLCGGATKETVEAVGLAIKGLLPEAQIISGGTLTNDPAVVRGLHECDAVILVEQLDKSDLNTAVHLKERTEALDKTVLGVVLSR